MHCRCLSNTETDWSCLTVSSSKSYLAIGLRPNPLELTALPRPYRPTCNWIFAVMACNGKEEQGGGIGEGMKIRKGHGKYAYL